MFDAYWWRQMIRFSKFKFGCFRLVKVRSYHQFSGIWLANWLLCHFLHSGQLCYQALGLDFGSIKFLILFISGWQYQYQCQVTIKYSGYSLSWVNFGFRVQVSWLIGCQFWVWWLCIRPKLKKNGFGSATQTFQA